MYRQTIIIIVFFSILNSCGGRELQLPTKPSASNKPTPLLSDDITPVAQYNEIEHLQQRLYSESPDERLYAAERLVSLNNKKTISMLATALADNNQEVIKSTLIAVGTYKKKAPYTPGLKYQPSDELIPPITTLLTHENQILQPFIYEVLKYSNPETTVPIIIKTLKQPQKDESIRCQIVRALAFVPTKSSIQPLLDLMTNKKTDLNTEINRTLYAITFQVFTTKEEWIKWWDENWRQTRDLWLNQAIISHQSLLKQKDQQIDQLKQSIATLKLDLLKIRIEQTRNQHDINLEVKLLTNALDDESLVIKKYALEQLRAMDKEIIRQIIPKLVEIISRPALLKSDARLEEEVKGLIITILSEVGDEKVIPALSNTLKNTKEQNIRDMIIKAFGRIGSSTAVPALLEMLYTEPETTILLIIDALDKIKPKETVPKLHEYISQPDIHKNENIVRAVIEVLGNLKEPGSAEIIANYIADLRKNVRWSTANSLGRMGLPEFAPRLVKLLTDEFADIRQVTVDALGKIGNKAVIQDLINVLLNDKDSRTRQLAATALGRFKDPTTIAPLIQIMSESDDKLTAAAWDAIAATISDNLELMEDTTQKLESARQPARAAESYQKIIMHPTLQTKEAEGRLMQNKAKLAKLLVQLKNYKDARPLLEDIQKYFSDKTVYTLLLIECYKNLEQYDLALKACNDLFQDIKVNTPEWWQLQVERVSVFFLKKEFQNTITEITKLIENPSATPEIKKKLSDLKTECEKALNSNK